MAPQHLELASRAERDLRRLPKKARAQVIDALEGLRTAPPAGNLDIRPLATRPGWLRLRVGEWRLLIRQLGDYEVSRLVLERGVLEGTPAMLVARIVNRRDLDRAIKTLDVPKYD